MNDTDKTLGCILAILALVVSPFQYLFIGWVIAQIWLWFVVPFFHTPELPISIAIGLFLLSKFVHMQYEYREKLTTEQTNERVIGSIIVYFVYPAVYLLIAFIVHSLSLTALAQ